MRYLKPHFYDKFVCTAGDCPDTCCAGWQIMIDDASLEKYKNVQGEFGKRLHGSVNWEEECFCQNERRCAFLNDENLCDLYKALGPDALCDTCRLYPRHTEEFEGLRELSLSLSCPEAAKIILSCKEPVRFLEEETDEEDDFDEFDVFETGRHQRCSFLCFTGSKSAADTAYGSVRAAGGEIPDLYGGRKRV